MRIVKRFLGWLWSGLSLPFIVLGHIWRFVATVTVLAMLVYVAVELVSYQRSSHRYSASGNCSLVEEKLASLGASMGRSFRCLNLGAAVVPVSRPQGMVFFLASSANPTMDNTGHGWVVWAKASVNEQGTVLVHEFQPVGFGPPDRTTKWPPGLQSIYATYLASRLPLSVEPALSKLLGFTWLSLQQGEESPVRFTETRPLDENSVRSPQFRSVFGSNPEAALVTILSDTEYENTKKVIAQFGAGDYSVLFRDCTTFVERVADEAGLYVPPRILHPFPSDFIAALSLANRK